MDFLVVVNNEGRYSLWPAAKDLPRGWEPPGSGGSRAECVAHIGRVWRNAPNPQPTAAQR